MSVRHLTLMSWTFLTCISCAMFAIAADDQRLTAVATQDEPRTVPQDNTAYFSRADRKVRFQLVKLSGGDEQMLAGTRVTVVGPTGQEAELTADEQGVATLDNAQPGLHAMVVTGPKGHTAVPVAFREADAPPAEVAQGDGQMTPVMLPLTDLNPKEVVRLTGSYLTPDMGGSYEDIDSEFVGSGDVSQAFRYRVRLGDEGTLDGQVYSLARSQISVAGTNVLIYRGNQLVGRATANDIGRFTIPNMVPGIYGLVAAGPAGYAAFAFEAYDAATVALTSGAQTLVSANTLAPGTILPVMLIPPAMMPAVLQQIRAAGGFFGLDGGFAGDGFVPPVPGAGAAPFGPGGFGGGFAGPGGGFGGGFGGTTGGVGGLGGLLGLAAIGGITAAAIEASDDDDEDFFVPPPATPSM
ncbi:MAG: hypothetical protein ACO1RT_19900 [Planctomycetaceae bacterium]